MNENQVDSRRTGQVFTEKNFYLEEFYGKSLAFALVPPGGERLSELDSLKRTLRELRRNQTRCIVIAATYAMRHLIRRLGQLAPRQGPIPFNPATGVRSRPYPPDSAISLLWEGFQAGPIVLAEVVAPDPVALVVFA